MNTLTKLKTACIETAHNVWNCGGDDAEPEHSIDPTDALDYKIQRHYRLSKMFYQGLIESDGHITPNDESNIYIHFTGKRFELVENGDPAYEEISPTDVFDRVADSGWKIVFDAEIDMTFWVDDGWDELYPGEEPSE